METLEKLFKKLHDNGLAIALDKCEFGKEEINYLGYKVNANGILPQNRKISAILNLPDPTTQKELLRLLGAINYFRPCLKGLKKGKTYHNTAELLQPLYAVATTTLKSKNKFSEIW